MPRFQTPQARIQRKPVLILNQDVNLAYTRLSLHEIIPPTLIKKVYASIIDIPKPTAQAAKTTNGTLAKLITPSVMTKHTPSRPQYCTKSLASRTALECRRRCRRSAKAWKRSWNSSLSIAWGESVEGVRLGSSF
jgi:hypothetical protein